MGVYLGTKTVSAHEGGQKGNFSIYENTEIIPSTEETTVPQKSLLKNDLTIKGDANLAPENIKEGVSIFGVDGTVKEISNGRTWKLNKNMMGNFSSILYANGIWVAATTSGAVYSEDSRDWISSNLIEGRFNYIEYGNGVWVISGFNGTYYSYDGKKWTKSNMEKDYPGEVVFGGNIFLCSSYYSFDGKEWILNESLEYPNSFRYGGGVWIAGTSGENHLYYSTDGINWNQTNISDVYSHLIYYKNDLWFVAGDEHLYYSTDGINWTLNDTIQGWINCIEYNPDENFWVLSLNSGILYYSTDGINWNLNEEFNIDDTTDINLNKITYANTIWVAENSYNSLVISTDGINWTKVKNYGNSSIRCICYHNNLWIVSSYEDLYYSSDGINWVQNMKVTHASKILYGNGTWVIANKPNSNTQSKCFLYYSNNGIDWFESNLILSSFYSLYYANGLWFAKGIEINDTKIKFYYSEDGKNWIESDITSEYLYNAEICYGGGLWILAYGFDNTFKMHYSYDGKQWLEEESTDLFNKVTFIKYADGIWVIASGGNIFYSEDGFNWIGTNVILGTNTTCEYLYNYNGLWQTCFGSDEIYYSTDGINWIWNNNLDHSDLYFANGLWFLTSTIKNYYSINGIDWISIDETDIVIDKLYYANGIWIGYGTSDNRYYSLVYSDNGLDWNKSNIMYNISSSVEICNANGIWLLGGPFMEGFYYSLS